MKKLKVIALLLTSMAVLTACTDEKQEQIDALQTQVAELQAEVEELNYEIDKMNYDYRNDPDTIAVSLNNENISDYFDLIAIKNPETGNYYVMIHSLMYDEGYVIVGESLTSMEFDFYDSTGKAGSFYSSEYDNNGPSFGTIMFCSGLSEGNAQEAVEKGIDYFNPDFLYSDATIYYQQLDDVKYGYEIKNGERIINNEDLNFYLIFKDNPF